MCRKGEEVRKGEEGWNEVLQVPEGSQHLEQQALSDHGHKSINQE